MNIASIDVEHTEATHALGTVLATPPDVEAAASLEHEGDADLQALVELSSSTTLLTVPIDTDAPPFAIGQAVQITIGSATDGILLAEAQVESFGTSPSNHLVLRLVSSASRKQRRHDVRLPLDVPARRTLRLTTPGGQPLPIRSRVLDISAGGVLLQTSTELRSGERLVVGFTLPGDGQEMRLSMLVRYSRSAEDSAVRFESGCQFQVVRPADRERIARYIFAQQREAARRRSALVA